MARDGQAAPFTPLAGGKMDCFEGLRGVASLAVLLSHLVGAFWPRVWEWRQPMDAPAAVRWAVPALARLLIDGQFAVAIFFLLSGFVLSLSFFRTGSHEALSSAAVRRYFRLMVPAAFSILLAYAVLKAGLMYNQRAAQYMAESLGAPHPWLTFFYAFTPRLKDALRECFWDALFGNTALYNQNLWTLSVEFAGSFLVYGFLALAGNLRRRGLCYLVVGVLLVLNNRVLLLDFLAGMALCDLYTANQARRRLTLPWPAAALLAAAGLGVNYIKLCGPLHLGLVDVERRPCYEAAAGALLLAAVAFSPALQRPLRSRPLLFLGKISFALYLVHLVVICSLASGLYLLLRQGYGLRHSPAAAIASLACVGVSMAAAWFMALYVDRPAVAVGRYVYEHIFKKSPPPGRRDGAAEQSPGPGLPSAA